MAHAVDMPRDFLRQRSRPVAASCDRRGIDAARAANIASGRWQSGQSARAMSRWRRSTLAWKWIAA